MYCDVSMASKHFIIFALRRRQRHEAVSRSFSRERKESLLIAKRHDASILPEDNVPVKIMRPTSFSQCPGRVLGTNPLVDADVVPEFSHQFLLDLTNV